MMYEYDTLFDRFFQCSITHEYCAWL